MIFRIKLLIKSFFFALIKLRHPILYFYAIINNKKGILQFKNKLKYHYDSAGALGLIYAITGQYTYGNSFENETIIDIGANRGYFSIFALSLKAEKIYAFEPIDEAIQQIRENLLLNNYRDRLHLSPFAVGSQNVKNKKIFLGDNKEDHSIYNLDNGLNFILIQQYSFEHVLNSIIQEKKIDLLKLNCEGSEYEILINTPVELIQRIKKIRLEFHNFEFQDKTYNINFLNNYLKEIGYQITYHTDLTQKHGIIWYQLNN